MSHSDDFGTDGFSQTDERGLARSPMLLDRRQWTYLSRRYDLTPREVQIAELVCRGLRQGSIAGQLNIQPGTVKTHVRNIYRKVKVKNKMNMLLRFVTEAQVLDGPGDSRP